MLFSEVPVLWWVGFGVTLTVPSASQPRLCKTEQPGTLPAAAHNSWERRLRTVAFLEPPLVDRAKQCLKLCALASAEISAVVVYAGSFGAEPK
jgi:hypothetical protein